MKKPFVFLLALMYMASSCEASVYLHYCMGKQVSFSFSPRKSGTCDRCGMKKSGGSMGCCKDEQKVIKSDKTQKVTDLVSSESQQKKFVTGLAAYRAYSFTNSQPWDFIYYPPHGPPRSGGTVSLYLMNCLFLI